jgi:hypothetical protein
MFEVIDNNGKIISPSYNCLQSMYDIIVKVNLTKNYVYYVQSSANSILPTNIYIYVKYKANSNILTINNYQLYLYDSDLTKCYYKDITFDIYLMPVVNKV